MWAVSLSSIDEVARLTSPEPGQITWLLADRRKANKLCSARNQINNTNKSILYFDSSVFCSLTCTVGLFVCWQAYKEKLRKGDGSLPGLRAAAAGSLAGMTECAVNTPFEVSRAVGKRVPYTA